jgi:hypothetical protein
MNLLDIRELKAGDLTLYIKLSMRSMIEFETLSGGSIKQMDTTEKTLMFLYCTAKAGAKSKGVEFKYTFDSFLDMLDEMDYLSVLSDFTNILLEKGEESKKKMKAAK